MGKVEQTDPSDLGFEVEIKSGGRAYDAATAPVLPPPTLSPARVAAKERARRRNLLIASACVLVIAALASWAYFSNPNSNVPDNAVARVNGEYIYQADVVREMSIANLLNDAGNSGSSVVTGTATLSAASALEEIINRKLQVQDAQKAGITATASEVDTALVDILTKAKLTKDQLQALLPRYTLTLDDLRLFASDIYMVDKYLNNVIYAGATSAEDRQNRLNDWQTRLAQSGKVDRLKPPGPGAAPSVGSEAPDFTLKDLDGKDVTLSQFKGKPVLINFWATWCPPCRAEIPTIAGMYNANHSGSGTAPYQVLGVATQSDDQTIRAFVQEFGMRFPVLPDADSHVTSLYHVLPIPTSFFVDKDGIIRQIQIGAVDQSMLDKWLLGK